MTNKVYDLSSRERPSIHKAVSDSFSHIKDFPCWNVRKGHDSFLTLEFGEPLLTINEYQRTHGKPLPGEHPRIARRDTIVRGEYHLYIYCCHWSINLPDGTTVHSKSPREDIEKTLEQLSGQILKKATVAPRNGSSLFEFDLGGKLQTLPYEESTREGEPHDSWMFFETENVLTYRADGKYAYHPSKEKTKEWFT